MTAVELSKTLMDRGVLLTHNPIRRMNRYHIIDTRLDRAFVFLLYHGFGQSRRMHHFDS